MENSTYADELVLSNVYGLTPVFGRKFGTNKEVGA